MALQDKLIDALGRFATTFNSYRYIMAIKSAFITLMPGDHRRGLFGADLQYGAGFRRMGSPAFPRSPFLRR
ncbi:putative PTS family enzyme IIC component [Klebsiella pneumoniae]|uniref:Putative PTS family enzyme IIC component n=1 Tax=Klebsiella pneumoniae TaxID=573 RepID=A0A378FRW0_KLEPN|nr:putative PTS family enzyme IIC component [Klebsiella pneumoniae]